MREVKRCDWTRTANLAMATLKHPPRIPAEIELKMIGIRSVQKKALPKQPNQLAVLSTCRPLDAFVIDSITSNVDAGGGGRGLAQW